MTATTAAAHAHPPNAIESGDLVRRKILVVTLRYPPYVAGGYELLTKDVVEALRERGHTVSILTGKGEEFAADSSVLPWLEPGLDTERDLFEWASGVSNLERFRLHFLRMSNWQATLRALAQTGADSLFFFNLGLVSLAPILAARCQGVPTLGYIADLWPLNHWARDWRGNAERAERKRNSLRALTSAWRTFRGLAGIGRLLVPSEYVAAELAADGVERASLGVVPLGLSPVMEQRAQNLDPRDRSQNEPLRVICSSMLWTGKGQHLLLEAGALAVKRGVDLQLVLAGGGGAEYTNRLRQLASRPELEGRVNFLGMIEAEQLSGELASSHVFALPSQWGEPFGLATLEAMAHGLCPLVSSSGASPEIVRHEQDGLVFHSGSVESLATGMEALSNNEASRKQYAESAGQRVRSHFDHAKFIVRVERELDAVCGGATL